MVLVLISTICYFFFLEQLLVGLCYEIKVKQEIFVVSVNSYGTWMSWIFSAA